MVSGKFFEFLTSESVTMTSFPCGDLAYCSNEGGISGHLKGEQCMTPFVSVQVLHSDIEFTEISLEDAPAIMRLSGDKR
jgi:hypothetical protein